jgi:hypothetical protein
MAGKCETIVTMNQKSLFLMWYIIALQTPFRSKHLSEYMPFLLLLLCGTPFALCIRLYRSLEAVQPSRHVIH